MTRPPSRRARPVNINKPILDSRFSYSRGQHRHVSRNVSPLASVPKDISKKQVSTQSSNTKVRATNLPSLLLSGLPQAEKGKGNIIVKKVAAQSVLRLRDDDSSQRDFPQPSAVVKAQDEKNRAAEQLTWEKVGAERRAAEQRQLELRQARQLELDKAEEARIRREEEERFRAMRAESQKVWERWKREKVTPTDVKLNIFAVQLAQVRGELRAEVQKAKQAAHQVWAKWDHNMVAPIEAQLEALGAKVQETWTDLREYRHLLKKNREQEAAQMEDRLKEVQDFRERRADHDMSRLENIHMNKFKSHRAIHRYTDGLSEVLEAIKDFHGACGHESFSFYCAPRRMIAQSDSGIRRRALIGLFWLQEPLRTFGNDVSFQIHLWRHYKRVRIQLEIHPRAFAFKRNTSVLYGLTGNLRNITEKVWHHHQFWLRHAETGHPRDGRGEDTWDNLSSQKRRIAQLIDGTMLSISDNLSDFNRLANHRKYSDPALQRQATVLMPFREVVLGMDKLENACEDLCRDLSRANLSQRMENRIAQLRGMVRHLRRERPLILLDIDKFLYFNWDVEERIALRFNRIPAAIYSYDDARAIRPIFLPAPRYNRVNRIEHAWRHTDFQGPNGQQVTVHYCVDGETIEKTARMFLESGVVGIDLWGGREFANIDEAVMTGNDTKRCVPMVALAIDERIALFHLAVTLKPSVQEFPTLKRILADSRILKVGENMAAIKAKISKYLFFRLDGGIELDLGHLPKAVSDRGTMDSGKGSVTLSDRTLRYFGQSLCDDEVDSQHLQFALRSPKLLRVTASRPYAAFKLYQQLNQETAVREPLLPPIASAVYPSYRIAGNMLPSIGLPGITGGEHKQTLKRGSAFADMDPGVVTLDPLGFSSDALSFRHYRRRGLQRLFMELSQALATEMKDLKHERHFRAYVIYTRFQGTMDLIRRVCSVRIPAQDILYITHVAKLPLREEEKKRLEIEKVTDPTWMAECWVNNTCRTSTALLRFQVKTRSNDGLIAYAMWHNQEMDVADIAKHILLKPKLVFHHILRCVKSKLLSWRSIRYRNLLREFDTKEFERECKHPTPEVQSRLNSWGQTPEPQLTDEDGVEIVAKGKKKGSRGLNRSTKVKAQLRSQSPSLVTPKAQGCPSAG